jgi:glycine/D-amino acid oxidase-like deaminating enzyme
MAVDAMSWRHGFDPWSQRVMTIALHTDPLGSADLESLGLTEQLSFYTVDLPLLWGRVMPDRSLLIGRETEPFPDVARLEHAAGGLQRAGARLSFRVRGLHPALREINVRAIWTGPIARTPAGHPAIVADPLMPQVFWAGGYGGQGLAQAFRLGQRAAACILGRLSTI